MKWRARDDAHTHTHTPPVPPSALFLDFRGEITRKFCRGNRVAHLVGFLRSLRDDRVTEGKGGEKVRNSFSLLFASSAVALEILQAHAHIHKIY